MPPSRELGRWGEALAARWLQEKGWQILARNWRHGPLELDLVARQGEVLVFVEVKTARSTQHGTPDVRVTPAKQAALARAAAAYLHQAGHEGEVRFDVISIVASDAQAYSIHHFVDAFFPGL